MKTSLRHWTLTAAVGLLTLGLFAATASAAPPVPYRGGMPGRQAIPGPASRVNYNYNPWNGPAPYATLPQFRIPINPNMQVSPGITYRQAAYNQAVMNYGMYANTPYAYYNPYVTSYNYNSFYPTTSYFNPYYSSFYNPYANYSYGSFYMNPYAFTSYGTGFGY